MRCRAEIQLTGRDNKPTARPTVFRMTTAVFDDILTASIKDLGITGSRQQEFLQALGQHRQGVYRSRESLCPDAKNRCSKGLRIPAIEK